MYAAIPELVRSGVPMQVVAERAEEVDLGTKSRQHHRRDAAAAGRTREASARMEHLARVGMVGDRNEVNPLDVTDDGHAPHEVASCEPARASSATASATSARSRNEGASTNSPGV